MTQSKTIPLAAAAVLGLAGLGLLVWWANQEPEHDPVTLRADVAPASANSGASAARAATAMTPASASEMLEIDPARYFDIGYAGGLIVDPHLRSKLEAVVATLPENPTPADLAKLEHQIRQGLPKEDADKAIRLMHAYRGFSKDMREEMMRTAIPQTQQQAMAMVDQMVAIQRRHFDEATVQAMFGPQNALSRLTVQVGVVMQDSSLDYADKRARIEALRAQLPAEQRDLIPALPAEPDSPKGP